ncbi:MAG TPA: DCC1-like thiol-disulfide oxidoreductase family protein [Gemmatimonadales bacterium]|nr:DCC1-like thiol-disulfide oxidoreductase family protein [Gemmatimonadales bacterium]
MKPGPLLLYDGGCASCSWWVGQVSRRDRRRTFRFASLDSALGREVLARAGLPPEYAGSIVLRRADGRISTKSTAALGVATGLGWPWRALAILRLVPRPLRDAAYDLVARHRRRARGETCEVGERGTGSGER